MNKSPWLEQLDQNRLVTSLEQDIQADLVIIGGGIAGMATAYFLLKYTNRKVLLIEAGKIAHGATGHNAGQVIAIFEKPFDQIVKEYGKRLAIKAQDAIESAWDLLDEIISDAKLSVPFYKFNGYTGYSTEDEIMAVLEQDYLNAQAGLKKEQLLIDVDADFLSKIPAKYSKFYTVAPQSKIQNLLDTSKNHFKAVGVILKGCLNSALLVEELCGHLLKKFPERFKLHEHSPVNRIILTQKNIVLSIKNNLVIANKVILCTNGFENLNIVDLNKEATGDVSQEIDKYFHEEVKGVVAYMAGFKEDSDKPPGAFTYYEGQKNVHEAPYFYLTRRPYQTNHEGKFNLVTIGGPETALAENARYDKDHVYPEAAKYQIDQFIRRELSNDLKKDIDYKFFWHGLMGYTKTGLRLIGPDPDYRNLLYNLGCNGVGILPSIYGARRIANFINKSRLSPMVFDPVRG